MRSSRWNASIFLPRSCSGRFSTNRYQQRKKWLHLIPCIHLGRESRPSVGLHSTRPGAAATLMRQDTCFKRSDRQAAWSCNATWMRNFRQGSERCSSARLQALRDNRTPLASSGKIASRFDGLDLNLLSLLAPQPSLGPHPYASTTHSYLG